MPHNCIIVIKYAIKSQILLNDSNLESKGIVIKTYKTWSVKFPNYPIDYGSQITFCNKFFKYIGMEQEAHLLVIAVIVHFSKGVNIRVAMDGYADDTMWCAHD